jgi:hypothetical protein
LNIGSNHGVPLTFEAWNVDIEITIDNIFVEIPLPWHATKLLELVTVLKNGLCLDFGILPVNHRTARWLSFVPLSICAKKA